MSDAPGSGLAAPSAARRGPLRQFVLYAAVGAAATCVQTAVFYALAATWLPCLLDDDVAVRVLGLPAAQGLTDWTRAIRFSAATAAAFLVSNVFCWLMNRRFVFTPGKFRWYRELAYFISVSALAMAVATAAGAVLIRRAGLMTTAAVGVEIFVSLSLNYVVRKFFIFKG